MILSFNYVKSFKIFHLELSDNNSNNPNDDNYNDIRFDDDDDDIRLVASQYDDGDGLDHNPMSIEKNISSFNNNDNLKEIFNHSSSINHHRFKRGVVGLASMIRCITQCNPLNYKDYGCYCGFQGEGYPVDAIDRYCYQMDDIIFVGINFNQNLSLDAAICMINVMNKPIVIRH